MKLLGKLLKLKSTSSELRVWHNLVGEGVDYDADVAGWLHREDDDLLLCVDEAPNDFKNCNGSYVRCLSKFGCVYAAKKYLEKVK